RVPVPARFAQSARGARARAALLLRRPLPPAADLRVGRRDVPGGRGALADAQGAPPVPARPGRPAGAGLGRDRPGPSRRRRCLPRRRVAGPALRAVRFSTVTIKVNGQARDVPEGTTVTQLIAQHNLTPNKVAVELNRRLRS